MFISTTRSSSTWIYDQSRQERYEKRCSTHNNPERVSQSSSLDEESEIDELSSGEEFCDRARTPRTASVTLELPEKSLLKATGQVADARNLSVRDHVAIVVSTITAGGGDFNQVTLSVVIGSTEKRKQT